MLQRKNVTIDKYFIEIHDNLHMINWFRAQFTQNLKNIFKSKIPLDDEAIENIENALLSADLGYKVTTEIINYLKIKIQDKSINKHNLDTIQIVKDMLYDILKPCEIPLIINKHQPYLIMLVGVNGAGKTTTIAKLVRYYLQENKKIMLAAGDTFRSAAIEQLQHWGDFHHVPVVAQQSGSDAASVIYDAYQSAKAKKYDILIADTAGRLHTQTGLMNELVKIKRVVQKLDESAPHEIMLILDASMGQNAILQAQEFHKHLGLTGVTITKLDGTAKGGVLFAIASDLKLPIRFIGIGEKSEDLITLDSRNLIEGLFDDFRI